MFSEKYFVAIEKFVFTCCTCAVRLHNSFAEAFSLLQYGFHPTSEAHLPPHEESIPPLENDLQYRYEYVETFLLVMIMTSKIIVIQTKMFPASLEKISVAK